MIFLCVPKDETRKEKQGNFIIETYTTEMLKDV